MRGSVLFNLLSEIGLLPQCELKQHTLIQRDLKTNKKFF